MADDTISLRDYLERLLNGEVKRLEAALRDHQRLDDQRHAAESDATHLSRDNLNRRLEAMNELRTQITSERGLYVTRSDYEAKYELLRKDYESRGEMLRGRLDVVEKYNSNMDGKLWMLSAAITLVSSLISTMVYIVLRFWK